MINKLKKMNGLSEQVKASTAYTICSILQRCLSFITLPVFSRLLTTEEYGISTVYTSTMGILIIFTTLQLPFGSFSTAMVRFEKDRDNYITAVNFICTCLTGLYFLIYLPFMAFWDDLLDLPSILMTAMGIEMLMSTALTFWMAKQRFEFKYKSVIAVTLSSSILATAGSIIAAVFSDDPGVSKILGSTAVVLAFGAVPYFLSMSGLRNGLKTEYVKYALRFNIPLIPYYLSQMIFNQSDRLMIDDICGRGEAAVYGVAYSLAIMLTFVLNAINSSYVPWFYDKLKNRDFEDNKRVTLGITVLMSFLLLGVIAFAPEIILIMAGEKYAEAVWVVPPVAMSLILLLFTQFSINVEFFYEEKKSMVIGSVISAAANVALNYIFIKKFGFTAAAYTTLFSYVIFAVSNYISMVRICKREGIREKMYDIPRLLTSFFVFCLAGFGLMALYRHNIIRYIVIAAVFLLLAVNIKKIISTAKEYISLFR